jgi:ABC-type bacteriocin/lantibiotic exporter with double-glycine peptidase domain
MGRSHVAPIQQPNDQTCGPAATKIALEILGIKKSVKNLTKLCHTNSNGTSTKNIIAAINRLGLPVLAVEYASLRHIRSALTNKPHKIRAGMVSYLYDNKDEQTLDTPHPDSGHWATLASYDSSRSRIVLFDSSKAQKKSYLWKQFRERWTDYDLKRRNKRDGSFRLVRKWQPQLLLITAQDKKDLPKFTIATAKLFLPKSSQHE